MSEQLHGLLHLLYTKDNEFGMPAHYKSPCVTILFKGALAPYYYGG